jgi:CheY-like chemotaxis protein
VVGDPGRLRQVIVNLVGNAIKFTERGQILVQVDVESTAERTCVLHYVVSDSGIGIPAEKQRAIFEPFKQADGSTTRRFGGTGLGLAISSTLVDLMGGRIWVESTPLQGSTFHFTVHLGVSDARPETLAVDLTDVRALIVDDNDVNRRVLHDLLLRWHMRPTAVDSGVNAMRAMSDAITVHRPFALVLLDANLPDMDGFEVASRVRADAGAAGSAIMMLSSSAQQSESARCAELGITHYLTKPVDQARSAERVPPRARRATSGAPGAPHVDAADRFAGAAAARAPGRRQSGEPASRRQPDSAARTQSDHRRQRARRRRRRRAAALRCRADGRSDA